MSTQSASQPSRAARFKPSIEAIDEGRAQQADDTRRHRVGRDEGTELPRPEVQLAHQLRRERHHDHEVHDVGELNRC